MEWWSGGGIGGLWGLVPPASWLWESGSELHAVQGVDGDGALGLAVGGFCEAAGGGLVFGFLFAVGTTDGMDGMDGYEKDAEGVSEHSQGSNPEGVAEGVVDGDAVRGGGVVRSGSCAAVGLNLGETPKLLESGGVFFDLGREWAGFFGMGLIELGVLSW
jgi:hypothetical protein